MTTQKNTNNVKYTHEANETKKNAVRCENSEHKLKRQRGAITL